MHTWSGFESLILIGSRTWEDHVFEELLAWQLGGVYTLNLGIYLIYSREEKKNCTNNSGKKQKPLWNIKEFGRGQIQ